AVMLSAELLIPRIDLPSHEYWVRGLLARLAIRDVASLEGAARHARTRELDVRPLARAGCDRGGRHRRRSDSSRHAGCVGAAVDEARRAPAQAPRDRIATVAHVAHRAGVELRCGER